jgi:hypothetical protein
VAVARLARSAGSRPSSAAALRCRGRRRLDGATRRHHRRPASRWWRPRSRARRAAAPPRPASGSRRRPRWHHASQVSPLKGLKGRQEVLMQMPSGMWVAQAVATAARLGIADALAQSQPQESTTLARAVGADRSALARLLRALASLGVLAEPLPHHYALTSIGELLRSDMPGSMRDWLSTSRRSSRASRLCPPIPLWSARVPWKTTSQSHEASCIWRQSTRRSRTRA